MKTKISGRLFSLLTGVLLVANAASAAVSTVAYYRMGENDPGATNADPCTALTGYSTNYPDLYPTTNTLSATYSDSTFVNGSSLCVNFDTSGGFGLTNGAIPLTDNWGIEAWVNSSVPAATNGGYVSIAYNGNSGPGGMGIYMNPGGSYVGLCGGVALVGGDFVVPNTWTHLAMVDNGGTTTFYVNGVATGTGPAPHTPSGGFFVGGDPGGENFQGSIDEVRVFTFAPGAFSTNDLMLTNAPPPPPPAVPTITSGPFANPSLVMVGDPINISVYAVGASPLHYYWQAGGSTVAEGTNSTVTLTATTTNLSSNSYSVIVSNSVGSVTSSVVNVTVEPANTSSLVTYAYYRLGEDDPGATAGQPVNNNTVDEINGNNLPVDSTGTVPTYSANAGVAGSTLSVAFSGGGYVTNASLPLTNNWSMEAWVNAATASPGNYCVIMDNGIPGGGGGGYGIVEGTDGAWYGLLNNVTLIAGAAVQTNVWTHLALVNTNGVTTFYVNGVATGSTSTTGNPPNGLFCIGWNSTNWYGGQPFYGEIDEARVCRVIASHFSPGDFLLTQAPPGAAPVSLVSGATVDNPAPLTGGHFTLNVVGSGTKPITYQWRKDGVAMPGVTNASVAFTNVTTANSGNYDAILANIYNSVTSAVTTVTVYPPQAPTLTPVAYFRMGENDPGASAGQPVTNTVDSINGVTLPMSGTGLSGIQGMYDSTTGVSGSSLGITLNGGGFTNDAAFPLTDNWGIEAWVMSPANSNPYSGDGYACLVYNGTGGGSGMGILQTPAGAIDGLIGGKAFIGSTDVIPPGTWIHVAIVTTGGVTTFYTNGVPAGTTGPAPNPATTFFGIGMNQSSVGNGESFSGNIDEVRVFTFKPGLFSTNLFLVNQAPPPPVSQISSSLGNMFLNWSGSGLEEATNVTGPWMLITNAPSPLVTPASGPSRFFRARP